jgi:hypothetical protein
MSRGQRTNKDLQKSSPKSDLSVIEKLFSHNRELSALSILELAVNKCLYQTNGLLLYFNDTYLIILNGVTSQIL